jgi:hypothetical protein
VKEIFGAGTSMYSGEIMKANTEGKYHFVADKWNTKGDYKTTICHCKLVGGCKNCSLFQVYKLSIAALNTGTKVIGPLTTTSGLKDELFTINCVYKNCSTDSYISYGRNLKL